MAPSEPPNGDEDTAVTVEVTPRCDGPVVITGPITLTGPDGVIEEHTGRTFLCRCGASATKPLCDGTHKRIGFVAPGVVPPRKPEV